MKKSVLAFLKGIVAIVAVLVFVVVISGCSKDEGALEKAGEKADKAIEETTKAAEKAGEKVGEGAEAAKDAVQKAGEKVKEGAEKTVDAVKKGAEKVEDKVKK